MRFKTTKKHRHFWQGVFTKKGTYIQVCNGCKSTRSFKTPKF